MKLKYQGTCHIYFIKIDTIPYYCFSNGLLYGFKKNSIFGLFFNRFRIKNNISGIIIKRLWN